MLTPTPYFKAICTRDMKMLLKNLRATEDSKVLVCFFSYLVDIYYQQNLNLAHGLGYHPHDDWTIRCSSVCL